jgi:hypothetical protein
MDSYVITGGLVTRHHQGGVAPMLLPSPDGRVLYTRGPPLSPDLRAVPFPPLPGDPWLVPAVQGDWYVRVRDPGPDIEAPEGGPVSLEVFRRGGSRPAASFESVDDLDLSGAERGEIDGGLFLVPDAQVLIILAAPKRSKLVLRRVELK